MCFLNNFSLNKHFSRETKKGNILMDHTSMHRPLGQFRGVPDPSRFFFFLNCDLVVSSQTSTLYLEIEIFYSRLR